MIANMLGGLGTAYNNAYKLRYGNYDIYRAKLVIHAGVVLCIAPLLIIYLAAQRYFIEGIERSGIVG